ncbi:hypothetical protein [Natronolimnobius baerhuensis]|uniref:hypothetical protein n=1 Tax=Natronolimnobius baerhuensis TaxID=253108 RepID=UPI0006CF4DF5|nr:hypothetical protein [Natronolimnobius baerhuensis]
MLYSNHSSSLRIDTTSNDARERLPTLEEVVLDLLEGEFAGVIRSHIRGEVYGGC